MFSSQMRPGSPFFVLTCDVVCTDVVGNGLPTLTFSRGIDMGVGYCMGRDFAWYEVAIDCCSREPNSGKIRPVAVPLVQQHQMTFQHNARPYVLM